MRPTHPNQAAPIPTPHRFRYTDLGHGAIDHVARAVLRVVQFHEHCCLRAPGPIRLPLPPQSELVQPLASKKDLASNVTSAWLGITRRYADFPHLSTKCMVLGSCEWLTTKGETTAELPLSCTGLRAPNPPVGACLHGTKKHRHRETGPQYISTQQE